jgi:tetratricopeptide (TPR) repeat protein
MQTSILLPDGERLASGLLAGRFQLARELTDEGVLTLQQQNRGEAAATVLAWLGCSEAVVSNRTMAIEHAHRALEMQDAGTDAQRGAALALAASGELEEARKIAEEVSREYPQSTLWQNRDLPTIQAIVELWQNNPEKAVDLLRPAKRFEVSGGACMYNRGRAFLALKKGEEGAAEFQKILDHPGITRFWMEYPAAIVGLARAKVLMGDEAGARKSYEEFLEMWKDADPDVPLLLEAQAEYAELQP